MSRTTLNLDPSVLRGLKRRARKEGKSIGDIVSEIVAPVLANAGRTTRAARIEWHSAPMGPARVDLEDKEAVRQALDRG